MTVLQIILISAMGGSLLTTGALLAIENRSERWREQEESSLEVINTLSTLQATIQKEELSIRQNLTAPDLLEVPCGEDYMEKAGEGLCREMFCRLQTREGDGASQAECEEIANLNNTLSLIEACNAFNQELNQCVKILDLRK